MGFDEIGAGRRGNRRRRAQIPVLMVSARLSEQRTARIRNTVSLVVFLCVLGAAGLLAAFSAREARRVFFSENRLFTIRELDLSSDGKLTPEHLRSYAGVAQGMNLYAVDLDRVRASLTAVPLVREVTVQRHLPGRLSVRVMERTPLVRVVMPVTHLPLAMDREGFVLGPGSASPALPLLSGAPAAGLRPGARITEARVLDAVALVDLCDRTRLFRWIPLEGIEVTDADHLTLHLAHGDRALLPRQDKEAKLRQLATIMKTVENEHLRGPDPLFVDMTSDANFPVRGLVRSP